MCVVKETQGNAMTDDRFMAWMLICVGIVNLLVSVFLHEQYNNLVRGAVHSKSYSKLTRLFLGEEITERLQSRADKWTVSTPFKRWRDISISFVLVIVGIVWVCLS